MGAPTLVNYASASSATKSGRSATRSKRMCPKKYRRRHPFRSTKLKNSPSPRNSDRCGLANVVLPGEDLQSDHECAAWIAGTIPACGIGDPGGSNRRALDSTSHRSIALTFRVFRACFLRELVRRALGRNQLLTHRNYVRVSLSKYCTYLSVLLAIEMHHQQASLAQVRPGLWTSTKQSGFCKSSQLVRS